MTEIEHRIAAGLERAFARQGFAEPSVGDLRDAAGVSLRTLYKYAESREEMVRLALTHRHARYIDRIFGPLLPTEPAESLRAVFARIQAWMTEETSHGCLFHAAVAASPGNSSLRKLLEAHKREVAERAAQASRLEDHESELILIIEGLTQAWPLIGERATEAARRLAEDLIVRSESNA